MFMRKPFKCVFYSKPLLYQMLNLRRIGLSAYSLAALYKVDRKAIEKQCNKYGVFPQTIEIFNIERITSDMIKNQPVIEVRLWDIIDGEKICRGRSYEDYFSSPRK